MGSRGTGNRLKMHVPGIDRCRVKNERRGQLLITENSLFGDATAVICQVIDRHITALLSPKVVDVWLRLVVFLVMMLTTPEWRHRIGGAAAVLQDSIRQGRKRDGVSQRKDCARMIDRSPYWGKPESVTRTLLIRPQFLPAVRR